MNFAIILVLFLILMRRQLCEPIRLLLAYTGIDYEERTFGGANGPDWTSVKPTLGLDFPNLPHFIDGEAEF